MIGGNVHEVQSPKPLMGGDQGLATGPLLVQGKTPVEASEDPFACDV